MLKNLLLSALAAGVSTLAFASTISHSPFSGGTGMGGEVPALITAGPDSLPPLSGIDLVPNGKTGTFSLELSQELEETATVRMTNARKKVVYTNSLAPQKGDSAKLMEVGKLPAGVYLVEVKTSNTTYWKKVRVAPTRGKR